MPEYTKKCSICGKSFTTTYTSKNMCSAECSDERVRINRAESQRRRNAADPPACEVCGFDLTIDRHHEGSEVYLLCPNHHALVTRNIMSLDEVFLNGYGREEEIAEAIKPQACVYGDNRCQHTTVSIMPSMSDGTA